MSDDIASLDAPDEISRTRPLPDTQATETHVAAVRAVSRPLAYLLHNGNGGTPMVRVMQDDTHANMWRMHWPDGRVSDMDNILRIREAAAAICERGPPARNRQSFKWTRIYRQDAFKT
jgi:hypothetical protein